MIEVKELTKCYGNIKAVDSVSFHVRQGEILGFLGPNGAGKSTTMRILTGFMPATSGTCRIGGIDVFEDPIGVKRQIGYLPENVPLYPELTVLEYLDFVARLKGIPSAKSLSAIADIIIRCGLQDMTNRLIAKLSKGYRQRLGIAQALIHDPAVIILDEPTIGLDPAQIRQVRELIKGLGQDHTIILSSHILPEVSQVCDRVLIINKGKIVAEDAPERLGQTLTGGVPCECVIRGAIDAVQAAMATVPALDPLTIEQGDDGYVHCAFQLKHEDQRPEVLKHLMGLNLTVCEFFTRKVTLEDVFLQLTTSETPSTLESTESTHGDHPESEVSA